VRLRVKCLPTAIRLITGRKGVHVLCSATRVGNYEDMAIELRVVRFGVYLRWQVAAAVAAKECQMSWNNVTSW